VVPTGGAGMLYLCFKKKQKRQLMDTLAVVAFILLAAEFGVQLGKQL
jgi:hypothetical protein